MRTATPARASTSPPKRSPEASLSAVTTGPRRTIERALNPPDHGPDRGIFADVRRHEGEGPRNGPRSCVGLEGMAWERRLLPARGIPVSKWTAYLANVLRPHRPTWIVNVRKKIRGPIGAASTLTTKLWLPLRSARTPTQSLLQSPFVIRSDFCNQRLRMSELGACRQHPQRRMKINVALVTRLLQHGQRGPSTASRWSAPLPWRHAHQ